MKTTGKRTVQKVRRKSTHKSKDKKNPRTGFTIIEVLIVLTIVTLILALIFLAVPAINRSARNHKRKAAVDYITTELDTYYSNAGRYPLSGVSASSDDRTSFVNRLQSGGLAAPYDIRYTDKNGPHEYPYRGGPADPNDTLDEISIEPGHICNTDAGLSPPANDYPLKGSAGGDDNYRAYTVWTLLESGPIYCRDNAR